ncbi:hypothetical protein D0T53_02705 [Dysgonomonas sp. 216]|uniref:phage holin family protein n=1 Tax=Dysgonomonas sp. 216 TaxID=2302934 RepID=UPI0013D166E4|nr:phage holin family protein [Dysgonomonas sp. 216]NDW17826.1 hypothetical protein [Dysgonomonas sp. 216]
MQKDDREEINDLNSLFSSLKDDTSVYVEKRLRIFKLRAYEKTSIASSYIVYGVLLCIVLFTIFILGLIALGFVFGSLLESYAMGFGVLILIVVLTFILMLFSAKSIRRVFSNIIVRIINKIEKDEE